jgi:hypothetical protein
MDDDPTDIGVAPADPAHVSTGLDQSPDPDRGWADPALADPDGREARFEIFYREHAARLVRFLILDGAPAAVAAELAQETMTALWRSWDTVTSPRYCPRWSRQD